MIASRIRLSALVILMAIPSGLQAGPVVREPGAIYLEDIGAKLVKLDVASEGPIYFDVGMQRYLGVLKKGQLVELQAVADNVFRVRGMAQQGQVVGWIDPKYLGSLKPDFLTNLRKIAKRQEEVRALIARKEVAINMTPGEVIASLGKAVKTYSRLDATGQHDVWEYIRYEEVPQQSSGYDRFGNVVGGTVYVKVPVGKLSVIFENNVVTTIEQSANNIAKESSAKIIATPINLY